MSDKEIYQVIANELKLKKMDTALWTQAIATAEGNPDKTEAAYIKFRFLDLKKSSLSSLTLTSVEAKSTGNEIKPLDNELLRLRTNLTKKLYSQNKSSLYSILGLQPDASDTVVSTAITDFESRNQDGVSLAEFKYAKNTLGNPKLREQYDRKLLESVSFEFQSATQAYAGGAMGYDDSWWSASKTSVIISILAFSLLGYFGLNYYKERNNHELQKETNETQREAVTSITDTSQMRTVANIDMQNQALRIAEERQQQEMYLRTSTTERVLEQQRLEQERRAQVEQQRIKLQQDQAENTRINMEKQYYACLNQQLLSSRNMTQADAYARCSTYHR